MVDEAASLVAEVGVWCADNLKDSATWDDDAKYQTGRAL